MFVEYPLDFVYQIKVKERPYCILCQFSVSFHVGMFSLFWCNV